MALLRPKRILFSGYAPVHFLCFLPIYRRLTEDPRVEVWLSGGFKREKDEVVTFSIEGFYDPFPVDRSHVIPLERAREEDFDVLVSAHLSDSLFPRSAQKTVQIFHGVSFKNLAVREKALRFDTLCLPGRYHAELYRKQGLIRTGGARCLLTGFAKADALVSGSDPHDEILRRLELDPKLPTVLFAPTGEKHNALDVMGREVIEAISQAGAWNLLVKPHDHPKKKIDWFSELAPFENRRVRVVRDLDVVPYLRTANILVTDASSVAMEYTLLDRPIVFLDVPKLLKQIAKRAPILDLDTFGRKIGVVVPGPTEVVAAIADSLAHPAREHEMRSNAAKEIFFRPGDATGRVVGVIQHAAGIEPALPSGVEEVA